MKIDYFNILLQWLTSAKFKVIFLLRVLIDNSGPEFFYFKGAKKKKKKNLIIKFEFTIKAKSMISFALLLFQIYI
jgi:hypothetical protein